MPCEWSTLTTTTVCGWKLFFFTTLVFSETSVQWFEVRWGSPNSQGMLPETSCLPSPGKDVEFIYRKTLNTSAHSSTVGRLMLLWLSLIIVVQSQKPCPYTVCHPWTLTLWVLLNISISAVCCVSDLCHIELSNAIPSSHYLPSSFCDTRIRVFPDRCVASGGQSIVSDHFMNIGGWFALGFLVWSQLSKRPTGSI